jgi:hypothetical protein
VIVWATALALIFVVSWSLPPLDKMALIILVSASAFGLLLAAIRYIILPARYLAASPDTRTNKSGNINRLPSGILISACPRPEKRLTDVRRRETI